MEAEAATLLVILTILWFLLYWVFGGVLFMLISVVRSGKMKRARFSCLYTLVAALSGYVAARLGIYWSMQATDTLPDVATVSDIPVALTGLGLVGILLGLLVGFLINFIAGWVVMLMTRSAEPAWYDKMVDNDVP